MVNRVLLIVAVACSALSLVVSLGGNVAVYKIATDTGERAEKTRVALCGIRENTEDQQVSSREFLRDHPKGIPGIPAALIQRGISQREDELRATSVLSCPENEER